MDLVDKKEKPLPLDGEGLIMASATYILTMGVMDRRLRSPSAPLL